MKTLEQRKTISTNNFKNNVQSRKIHNNDNNRTTQTIQTNHIKTIYNLNETTNTKQ